MEVDLPRDIDSSTVSRPWASLDYSGFRLIFLLSLFATTAQQMRQTQNLYQVYELSGSALQLGLTGLAQGIPIFSLGLFAGTLADFLDRKKLLLITIFGNCLVAVVQGLLTLSGAIQVWHILVGTALTSALNIVLNPRRMSLISRLVPRSHLTNAVSLNSSVSQSSFFFGPMAAGVTLAALSTGNAYLVNGLFYVPAAIAILRLHPPAAVDGRRERFSLVSILGGVKFLFSEPIVFAMVMLDFAIVGLGYYRPLLPIFAKDILHVGPTGYGVLSSAPAVGGVLGTVIILFFGDIDRKGHLALWAFLSYALAVGIFAMCTQMALSLVLLGLLGLANSLQAVMRQTSFHLLTPDHLRGRAFAVFNMFSQGANSVSAVLTLGCWIMLPGLRKFGIETQHR